MKLSRITIISCAIIIAVVVFHDYHDPSARNDLKKIKTETKAETETVLIDPNAKRGLHSKVPMARKYAESGKNQMDAGKYTEAIKLYELAIKEDPYHSIYHSQLGTNYYAYGDLDTAEYYWQKAIDFNSNNKSALVGKAIAEHKRGEFRKAIILGERVLSLDSKNNGAIWGLAHSHKALGNYNESIRYFNDFILYSNIEPNRKVAKEKIIEIKRIISNQ